MSPVMLKHMIMQIPYTPLQIVPSRLHVLFEASLLLVFSPTSNQVRDSSKTQKYVSVRRRRHSVTCEGGQLVVTEKKGRKDPGDELKQDHWTVDRGNHFQDVLLPKFWRPMLHSSMSITPELRASARSAYRYLLRAASSTFSGALIQLLEASKR